MIDHIALPPNWYPRPLVAGARPMPEAGRCIGAAPAGGPCTGPGMGGAPCGGTH